MLKRFALLALLFCAAVTIRADEAEVDAEAAEEVAKPHDSFSEEERATIDASQETHEFQAEVTRLMDILINSLYSNREIFIRELVSNAADALDKVRYMSLTDDSLLKEGEEMGIKVSFDKDLKTITITDQGIGMTKEHLMKNLGIVAKSGTSDFLDAAAKGSDSVNLIGQFGVGFYSVYLVADKVTVISKHNDDDQHIWESTASNIFTVAKDPRGNTLGRGTSIVLHLKEDAEEFMDETLLSNLIKRYSQFINFPISLKTTKTVEEEVELTPEEIKAEKAEDAEEGEDDVEVSEEEDEDSEEKKTKTVTKTVEDWKVLNDAKPLWTKNPKDVSEEEYEEFYKSLTKDTEAPLDKIHFVAEGEITFRAILYVPKTADAKIYDQYYEKSTGLKLYVRRVLISDEFEDFLPKYMNFVKGIVDSDDLPLNVSRETLAQSRVLKVMSKKLTRKVLEMLRKMADRAAKDDEEEDDEEGADDEEEAEGSMDYETFWSQYSKSIKMGVMDDKKNKAKLVKLLRFKSSTSDGKLTSFEEYVDRMGEDQSRIFFLTCENMAACVNNPIMEKFNAKKIEVLFMDEAVDEYCVQHIHEFDGIEPVNAARQSAILPKTAMFKEMEQDEDMKNLKDWFKEILPDDEVSSVVISNKLTTSPAACSAPEYGWTGNMERIMKSQAMQKSKDIQSQVPKKIFEFNPFHPIIKEMAGRVKENAEDESLKDMAFILYDAAAVVTGYSVKHAEDFAKRLHKVVSLGLDVDPDAPMTEEAVEVEDEEVAEEAEAEETEEAVDSE